MARPKICPLHKGDKPSDGYCVESACAWYLEWAKSCSVPVSDFAPTPTWNRAVQIVEDFPAADVVKVRHGKWINERQEGLGSFSAECSQCGKRTLAYFHYFYCPSCGAKMDGGQDE